MIECSRPSRVTPKSTPPATGLTIFWAKLPSEANALIVHVHIGAASKLQRGKLFLNTLDHGIDPTPAFARYEWVEVCRIFRPGTCDQFFPAIRIRLIPCREIAINQFSV
jgi:hypothetical protein